jgi:hypothetical protein
MSSMPRSAIANLKQHGDAAQARRSVLRRRGPGSRKRGCPSLRPWTHCSRPSKVFRSAKNWSCRYTIRRG